MKLRDRYILFIAGLFFASLGICLVIKGSLGTSPISSLPYVLSLAYPLSLGAFTLIVNIAMLLGQFLILRREFGLMQLLQAPMTVLFSLFIDTIMLGLACYAPTSYPLQILTVLLGCAVLGLGVALEIIGNVVMLPGEGLVYTIAKHWKLEFGKTKIAFDTTLVVLSLSLSLLFFGAIQGLREGTLLSAYLVGAAARFFIARLSKIDRNGALVLRWYKKN